VTHQKTQYGQQKQTSYVDVEMVPAVDYQKSLQRIRLLRIALCRAIEVMQKMGVFDSESDLRKELEDAMR